MTIKITLAGPAAGDAQTLVTDLLAEQITVVAANNEDLDRNTSQVAIELGVSLVASGTYDIVTSVVRRWCTKRGHNETDVSVEPTEPLITNPDDEPTE